MASAALASAMCFGAGQAQASHVACGDTITADTTLDSDLVNCPSNGIVIGADDITLDLNDHTVAGDGEPFEACPEGRVLRRRGVQRRPRRGHGRETARCASSRSACSSAGAPQPRARDLLVEERLLRRRGRRLIAERGPRQLVEQQHRSGGRRDRLVWLRSHRIVDNSIEDNPGPGIHVDDSTHNLIKGNLISHSGPGILIEADRNEVRRNRFVRNRGGIIVAQAAGT